MVFDGAGATFVFHEWQRDAADRHRKLRHNRVTQDLGGDGGTIRNIENMAINNIIHSVHPEE
ncbi:hypothetical protein STM474_1353 [Salmonella enterica subsp. enterica serovar Typhimurium str. ST4/74]|uniref:Uncharacterized protein n=1 Tax=Salmonella typhimurium (strain 4/74) TaxID=909946 RepID=E8XGF5_SALT4|nr:hypothetical protein STM474_1353 [Salmonella enterica subsp. enterica serovar Typhimurium str. ST4/74]